MLKWLNSLPDTAKGAVYGALIGAAVSLLVYLLTFAIKDYLIPILFERRKIKREAKDAFKKYKNPLIIASEALAYRLKEIFENRSYYLIADAPKTEFYSYKYINTLYRLASLLGYVRGLKIELLHLQASNEKQFSKIEKSIKVFEKSLADGQDVELRMVKSFCSTWNVNTNEIDEEKMKSAGFEINNLTDEANYRNKTICAKDLCEPEQMQLVQALKRALETSAGIVIEVNDLKVTDIINEVSIKEAYLYRDWQQSIGDLMLKPGLLVDTKFSVLGYKEFEEFYFGLETIEKKWVSRIENLFANVDIKTTEEKLDARIVQLKRIYQSVVEIIVAFKCIKTGVEPISKESLENLQSFNKKLLINPIHGI